MGRHNKIITNGEGIDVRDVGYYSTPKFISDFISHKMLNLNPEGLRVLDPCVGKEEMLEVFYKAGKSIDGIDIFQYKQQYNKCNFLKKDFLEYYRNNKSLDLLNNDTQLNYDYYLANPPYNCHEVDYIKDNKASLKKLFPKVGVANMYAMFFSAMIDLAKPGAIIGLIIFDSFLTARIHENLRKQIQENCIIHYLLLCPMELFRNQKADVRTCIMILEKGKSSNNKVKVLNRTADMNSFKSSLQKDDFETEEQANIVLRSIKDRSEFVIGCPVELHDLFKLNRIGDTFKCITGISTGNDTKYISTVLTEQNPVPFIKNPARRRFYTEPDGYLVKNFLELDKEIPNFMVRNKNLLFKKGIACSSMGVAFSAAILDEGWTFGVNTGIFPPTEDRWWLLAYLNSSLVTYLLRAIMLRTNMVTSGYVSRVPLLDFTEKEKSILTDLAKKAYDYRKSGNNPKCMVIIKDINELVLGSTKLKKTLIDTINNFTEALYKFT